MDSGPIGLSLIVVIAEGFLQVIEKNALNIARLLPHSVAPITHRRYVDDTHDRFTNQKSSEEFLNILNAQEPRIQFVVEYQNNEKSLNFLDTTITNNNGKYEFQIFRKEAITNVQVKVNSCHEEKVKYGIFKGFIHRAKSICSERFLEDEINFLIDVFTENGYERSILESIATPNTNQNDRRNNINR